MGKVNINSYSNVRLSTILPQCTAQCRIGLWNWYLPTLSILLLTEGIGLKNIWSQLGTTIRTITDTIVNNKDKFLLLDDPTDATNHLVSGDIWIIPGGAGWLMPLDESRRQNLEVIVPKEGAIMWIESASIIRNPEGNEVLSRTLIEYLLESKTQIQLAQRRAYRTCPVSTEALQALPAPIATVVDYNNIFDASFHLKPNVELRDLPGDWRTWEQCWENIENNVPHH